MPLVIGTNVLPGGQTGTPYSATITATGGALPYTWSLTNGSTLPAGLSLAAATGTISGTPTAPVNGSSITFTVQDSSNPVRTQSVTLALTIAAVTTLAITTTTLPDGQVGQPYSAALNHSGGTNPVTWSITAGALPASLTLNAATGAIAGPSTASVTNSSITFMVRDSSNPVLSQSVTLTLTIAPATPLAITTTSLPNGQVGSLYSYTLASTGGLTPITWLLISGTLPPGLSLNAATGAIAGTPTAAVANAPLTIQALDASSPAQTAAVNLTLTIAPNSGLTVAVTPKRAGLTATQKLSLAATTNDSAGVNWSISPSGGSFNPATSMSGASVTLTAPSSAGSYTVTATSVSDSSKSSSITIGVTDLPGVFSYHNNISRDGANTQEYALTTANVNTATFGKLFSCPVDGAVYAQPLWIANLMVAGVQRNVVFVATQHDSLYAFDADAGPCVQLWHSNLIDTAHGATTGELTVPAGVTGSGNLVGQGFGDITPEVGVTGTPVIDPATKILYVVSKSMNAAGTTFYQRLHAIDLATGNEKANSPILIAATFSDASGTVTFNSRQELQRAGLALVNGVVYIAWASHEDALPYHGWVISYGYGSTFTRLGTFVVAPKTGYGGIWQSGAAPAADSANNLYFLTGNAKFDIANHEYGDSLVKLTSGLSVASYFTPTNESANNLGDLDFGAGGAAVLADLPAGSPVLHLLLGGGKDGALYVLNRDLLGAFGDANAVQRIPFSAPQKIFATGAFWNNFFYLRPADGPLLAYHLDPAGPTFTFSGQSRNGSFQFPGSTPSVSANGTTNGIVWDLDNRKYCTNQSLACGPAVLHAYDATNVAAAELWNSATAVADTAGNAVKFTVPTVANSKVYVGTRGNNTGGVFGTNTISGQLDVYGLQPN